MASKTQKNYLDSKKNVEIKKPDVKVQTYPQTTFKSYGMRI